MNENESTIADAAGLDVPGSPAKSPAGVLDLSLYGYDREAFLSRPKPNVAEDEKWTWVYLMSCGDFTKVGIARAPRRRMADLQRTNPHTIKLEAIYVFQSRAYAFIAEQAAHAALAAHRGHGEWFNLPVAEVRPIVRKVVTVTRTLRGIHRRADIAAGIHVKPFGF